MTSKCKKSQIWPFWPWKMTFRAIQPNLSFDMWFMSPKRSFMPKKKKSYWSVSEIDPSPPQSWRTDGRTDRQTGGQTDRRTTDKSVLEKLRCLSAGGAKKRKSYWSVSEKLTPTPTTTDESAFEKLKKYWKVPLHLLVSNTDLSVVRLSVRPSVCLSVCPSRLRGGGGVYLRNASVTFLLFWHGASLGWHKSHIER